MPSEPPASPVDGTTVSVVIPVKDDDEELARCLRALHAQTRPADEIIVVDNGSSDSSRAVAERAGTTLVSCSEPGIPAASSHGYDHASGELILRLDADCIPGEAWVQAMVSAFAERPDVAAFTGGARFIDGPALLRVPLAVAYLGAYGVVGFLSLGHLPLFGSNLALRRSAWLEIRDRVHRHDSQVHDDFDLAFHLGERHRIRYLHRAAMGMSMRPFASARAFATRFARGVHTVTTHWPEDFPPHRWSRRRARDSGALSRSAGGR